MRVIHLLRKPLSEGTVAANTLRHGAGGLNIDASRVTTTDNLNGGAYTQGRKPREMHPGGVDTWKDHWENKERKYDPPKGRWPANLILNHLEGCGANWVCVEGCPVRSLDEQSGVLSSGVGAVKKMSSATNRGNQGAAYGAENRPEGTPMVSYGDKGGASRFFKQVGGKFDG